ncbi:hypothetical protein GRF59_14830 [Paenibacillus sp. HJL G12]|uniref:Uncharacterized protein n=1 Tax=Paenibacillus dendrobii TaxID=2691084 RepID=A0A7X3IJ22_9BACL|nr:hypothetical protein [Paenibacillus dendrobii]MWV44894.1 hypothetical protein [Paenibacillus dendrobii]
MNLQPTYGYFELIGKVTGLTNSKAFDEGNKNDFEWNRMQFGVKTSENSFVYVELMGNKAGTIKMYKNNSFDGLEDIDRYELVKWDDIYKQKYSSLRLPNCVKTNVKKDDGEEDVRLTSYDAIYNFKEHLTDGETVLIKGLLQFNYYNQVVQERFIIKEIYSVADKLFEINDPQAFFNQEVVFIGVEDSIINTKIIVGSNNGPEIIDYSFRTNNIDVISNLRKLKKGSTIRLYGNIRNYVPITIVNGLKVVTSSAIKELEVTGGINKTIKNGRYKPEDLVSQIVNGSPFEDDVQAVTDYGF